MDSLLTTTTVLAIVDAAAAKQQAPASTAVPFDITQILQFGLLGLIFLCILFRKFLVPEWTLKAAEDRASKEKAELEARLAETRQQLDKLQGVFQDQMIPALTRATEINARFNEELQRARFDRRLRRGGEDVRDDEPGFTPAG